MNTLEYLIFFKVINFIIFFIIISAELTCVNGTVMLSIIRIIIFLHDIKMKTV